MSPELESRLRKFYWPLLVLAILGIAVAYFLVGKTAWNNIHNDEPAIEEPIIEEAVPATADEWLYVTDNSVLLFPVVNDKCRPKYALMQVHRGTKVLVIARHGEWVEIEQEDQTALATHGCIHESMLEKRDND